MKAENRIRRSEHVHPHLVPSAAQSRGLVQADGDDEKTGRTLTRPSLIHGCGSPTGKAMGSVPRAMPN